MQEFESISASSYDPSALATKLTAKAAEGWSVVAIVPTGGDVTAFLSRDKGGSAESTTATDTVDVDGSDSSLPAESPSGQTDYGQAESGQVESGETESGRTEPSYQPSGYTSPDAPSDSSSDSVNEPSGWAIAPDPVTPTVEPTGVQPTVGSSTYEPSVTPTYEPSVPSISTPAAQAPEPAPAPAVPAGWYADPAGRFELRYWDGGTWTEHVSRAGQQFTDPPVA